MSRRTNLCRCLVPAPLCAALVVFAIIVAAVMASGPVWAGVSTSGSASGGISLTGSVGNTGGVTVGNTTVGSGSISISSGGVLTTGGTSAGGVQISSGSGTTTYNQPSTQVFNSTPSGIAGQLVADSSSWVVSPRYSGTTNDLLGIAYGNGTFVAVGSNTVGTLLTSPDGVTWTPVANEEISRTCLLDVTYAAEKNMFVAVGCYGAIFTSRDGLNWTNVSITTTRHFFHGVAYGNGTFVALGFDDNDSSGTNSASYSFATSTDGVTWQQTISSVKRVLLDIVYANGKFVAVGGRGTIVTSPDGSNWTQRISGTENYLNGIAYGGSTFCVVGDNIYGGGSAAILTSTDGVTWVQQSAAIPKCLYAVGYGNDAFVAVGTDGSIFASSDATNWSTLILGTAPPYLRSVSAGAGSFVAVGDRGTIVHLEISQPTPKDTSWVVSPRVSGTTNDLLSIAYGNGTFVAVGSNTVPTLLTSPDGVTWTPVANEEISSGHCLIDVTYAAEKNMFVAVGCYGAIFTSPDGFNWTNVSITTTGHWFLGVAYGNGTFVALGYDANDNSGTNPDSFSFATSTDGVTWQQTISIVKLPLLDIVYAKGTFVAVGMNGTILTSPDGINWTQRISGTENYLNGIAYGGGIFCVVGDNNYGTGPGTILTSTDGVTWVSRGEAIPKWLYAVAYGNDAFVAVGPGGSIFTSSDATNWNTLILDTAPPTYLRSVSAGVGSFVTVGDHGTILQLSISQPTPKYTLTVQKGGTGSGTVTSTPAGIDCGADCSEPYDGGTIVALTATAAPGSKFTSFQGPCAGGNPCVVAMDANKQVAASFGPGKPVVTVTAPDATATEQKATTGYYRIARTGSTAKALNVTFTMSGTATARKDYTLQQGYTGVTIPARKAYTDVVLKTIDDKLRESTESAALTVLPAPAYDVGTPASAAIVIIDND